MTEAYVVALVEVALGAVLATLFVAGWPPVLEAWGHLKPAHGWLNLVGFVSLVIGTTLLHFFPTVIGARIATHPTARLTVVGLAAGAPIVAVGYVLSSDLLARVGALLVVVGAGALPVYARRAWSTRGRWTTDLAWHRFAMIGLASAIAWFEIGIAIAAGRILAWGADPEGWSIELIAGPLLLGWVGCAVLRFGDAPDPGDRPGRPGDARPPADAAGACRDGPPCGARRGHRRTLDRRTTPSRAVGGGRCDRRRRRVRGHGGPAGGGDRPAAARRASNVALTPADPGAQADGPSSSGSTSRAASSRRRCARSQRAEPAMAAPTSAPIVTPRRNEATRGSASASDGRSGVAGRVSAG